MVPPEFLDARNSLTEPWQSEGLALSHFLPFFLLQLALGRHLGVAFFSPFSFLQSSVVPDGLQTSVPGLGSRNWNPEMAFSPLESSFAWGICVEGRKDIVRYQTRWILTDAF